MSGLIVTGGLLLLVNHPRQADLTAAVYALAVLVHPDGMLFGATALAYVLWRRGLRRAVRFAAVGCVILMPHAVWSLATGNGLAWMGVAGSTDAGPWKQGVGYTWAYFRTYAVLGVCVVIALAGWTTATLRGRRGDPRLDVALLAVVQLFVVVVAVTARGGEPPFPRAYMAVTPLVYLAAEDVVRIRGERTTMAAFAAVVTVLTLVATSVR